MSVDYLNKEDSNLNKIMIAQKRTVTRVVIKVMDLIQQLKTEKLAKSSLAR